MKKGINVRGPICDKNFVHRNVLLSTSRADRPTPNMGPEESQVPEHSHLENVPSKVSLNQSFDDPTLWKVHEKLQDFFFAENGDVYKRQR